MAQLFHLFAATSDRFLFLGAANVVVVRLYRVVTIPIGLQEPVPITAGAAQGDVWQRHAAGSFSAASGQADEAAGLHRDDGIVKLAQAGEDVGIGLIGLVKMLYRAGCHFRGDFCGQVMSGGDFIENYAQRYGAPAAFAFGLERSAKICRARPNAQGVGGPAVLRLVDGIRPFIDQPCVAPAQPQVHHCALRWDFKQSVVVAEGNAQLVSLKAPIVCELQ
ncbi:hypothetical protein D3C81_1248880 [compost metagenome]